VPARNEAHNLPTLLRSLAALEPPPLEVLVIDDHSTDDTAAVARAHGAIVVEPGPRPANFVGKPWACLAGARVARGRYLLFTDADTQHAPDSLVHALRALIEANAGLLSLVPTHRIEAGWEKLQGIFQLLLLIATRADARHTPDRKGTGTARPFAIGQYLLFRRDAYDAVGGHAATPHRIAEDLALARLVRGAGFVVRVAFAPNALLVRMYPEGVRAFFSGWRRNFRDGLLAAGLSSMLEMAVVVGWLLGSPLWLCEALCTKTPAEALGWASLYLLTVGLVAREQSHYGKFSPLSAFVYPLFVLVFVAVTLASLLDALLGRPVKWRGRTFVWER
jgi:4,4'-diaponeurosporenoate glycosyltransferase